MLAKRLWSRLFIATAVLVAAFVYLLPGKVFAPAGGSILNAEPEQVRPVLIPGPQHVPILAYHNIRPTPDRVMSAVDKQYEVTPEQFEKQMAYLESEGFGSISFEQLRAAISGQIELPPKPVIISLDDGRESQFEYAFPILKKHGLKATFFVFSNAVGRPGYVTPEQILELHGAGMEIGSHTRYHQFLTRMKDDGEISAELSISKKALEDILGQPVTTLAYPFGLHDERVERLTREAGYETARGLNHTRVHGPDDLFKLGSFITTGDEKAFRMILSTP